MPVKSFFGKIKEKYFAHASKQLEEIYAGNNPIGQLMKTGDAKVGFISDLTGGEVSVDSEGFVEEQDLVKNFLGDKTSDFVKAIAGDFSFDEDDGFFNDDFDLA